jgi:hypothetical protein
VNDLPQFIELSDAEGADTAERWRVYLEVLHEVYQRTLVRGGLSIRGLPMRCRRIPESRSKHFGFWHLVQEGYPEEDRLPDLERCRRLLWVSWVVRHADSDSRIRVFRQTPRHGEKKPWALWLPSHDYVVIVAERSDHCLLKTAFLVQSRTRQKLERDWNANQKGRNG